MNRLISITSKRTGQIIIILGLYLICLTNTGFSQDAQTFYKNGYQYFAQGDYQKSEENYQEAINLNPNYEDAHYWLGKVFRETGQYDKAIRQWIEVLRINPRNPYAFRYLNESYRDVSRVKNGTANDYFSEGLEMLGITNEAFLDESRYSSQTLLSIVPYFKKAIGMENGLTGAHYWLAEIYQALSKKISWQYTSVAISSFEKAIAAEEEKNNHTSERPSEYWHSYQELMVIYQSLGLNERKEKLLSQLEQIKADPYEQVLNHAGYHDYGYPDHIEIIKDSDSIIELWKYSDENKTFRVINNEIVGEELSFKDNLPEEESTEKKNTDEN